MRIKKFTGRSLADISEQMRKDLGPEAIILNTRTLHRGGLGFLGKELLEVTAAIDDDTVAARREPDTVEGLADVAQHFQARRQNARRQVPDQGAEILEMKNDMEDMKGTLKSIADQLRHTRMPSYPPQLQQAFTTLMNNDVDPDLAQELLRTVHTTLSRDEMNSREAVEARILEAITRLIPVPPRARERVARVIALVGPTGVGKTTTIAKLAAVEKLLHNKQVGLISTDTYRIGAIDQLRTFAAIADMPMQIVYRPSEMESAMHAFRDKDVVFVDTVGRSPRSKKDIEELARFVRAAKPDETHLVLSAATGLKAALETVNQFAPVKPNRVLFSKLDEAMTLGPLLSILQKHRLPLGYLTVGQTVPDDIMIAEPPRFASMVYTGVAHA